MNDDDLPPSSTAAAAAADDEDVAAAATASAASEIRDETSNDTSGSGEGDGLLWGDDDDRARLRHDLDGGAKAKTPSLDGSTARSKTSKDIIVWIVVGERDEKEDERNETRRDATSQERGE